MNFEKLDELVAIPKKSDASKAIRKEYKAEIAKLLKEDGFSESAEKYLWSGFSFCGAEPLFDFVNFHEKDQQAGIIEKILKCRTYIKNEKSNGFKMCISLLIYELNYCPDNAEIIGMLIKGCVATYKKKDGSISKDNAKIVEKYFIAALNLQAKLPGWDTITINPFIVKEFCNYIVNVSSAFTDDKSKEKVKKIVTWMKSVVAATTETVSTKEADTKLPSSSVPTSDVTNSHSQQNNAAGKSLFATAAQLKELTSQVYSFAEESEKSKRTIATLLADKAEKVAQLKTAEGTITDLRELVAAKEADLTAQKLQLTELSSEVEKLKAVISVYSEDKQSSMDGQLNAIASKLKTEYSEFKDALDLDMTAEIGEILRDQLMRVFKILSKAGIDIESR